MNKSVNPRAHSEETSGSVSSAKIRAKVEQIIEEKFTVDQFPTVEEFIHDKINRGELKLSAEKGTGIRLEGNLNIDDSVASGLDWSSVVCTSANVKDGKISEYQYLPLAKHGISTTLEAQSAAEYVQHNYYGVNVSEPKINIAGKFKIPAAAKLPDFSNVTATQVICYSNKVSLSRLPTARKGFYNLPFEKLEIDCENPGSIAKAKGLNKEICRELQPSFFQRWLNSSANDHKKEKN